MRHCAARDLKPLEDILDRLKLIMADIAHYPSVSNALRTANPDCVIHSAALTPVRYSFEHPFQYEQYNYFGTMNVCHAFMELPDFKKRFLLAASTAEVYGGGAATPTSEDSPLNPSSPYAVSKAAADMYLRMASKVFGINCVVMRPTNTYGRRYETGFIIEYLITSMLRDEKVYVGAPDSIRDYIYVDDHVNSYVQAMEKQVAGLHVFNVGSGKGVTNRELADNIADLIGYPRDQISHGTYPLGYPFRPKTSDQPEIILDPARIQKELSWTQKVPLKDGLARTRDFWAGAIRKS